MTNKKLSMLLNNFFKILEITGQMVSSDTGNYNFNFELNPQHDIYQGHFPGNPVVPGVCLIEIIKENLQEITGSKLMLIKGTNIKFLNIVQPEKNPILINDISFQSVEAGVYKVKSTIHVNSVIYLKFDGEFKKIPNPKTSI